jgi:hypothetical protein
MNWLRKIVRRWLDAVPAANGEAAISRGNLLDQMSDYSNPTAVSVVPVRNGFLICRRTYNPNGPDKVDAVYAATIEDLGPLIVAELATVRLTK